MVIGHQSSQTTNIIKNRSCLTSYNNFLIDISIACVMGFIFRYFTANHFMTHYLLIKPSVKLQISNCQECLSLITRFRRSNLVRYDLFIVSASLSDTKIQKPESQINSTLQNTFKEISFTFIHIIMSLYRVFSNFWFRTLNDTFLALQTQCQNKDL